MTDHISDYLFAPTDKQANIARTEGIEEDKIFTVGNTIVDAVHQGIEIAERKSDVMNRLDILVDDYVLMTSHRPATVDNKTNLSAVLEAVQEIASKYRKQVIFPAHPRTAKMIESFNIKLPENIKIIEPVGYLDMLMLQKNAFLIMTDSGGIQEEACILKKKAIVMRENTERPEAVEVGGCVLGGNSDTARLVTAADGLLDKDVDWYNPFGDGASGQKIIKIVQS